MTAKQQKILLLRAYARNARSYVAGEPPGLEQFIPRISTPTPESFTYKDDNDLLDRYELFRVWLGKPPERMRVRGMRNAPPQIFSGNFIPEEKVAEAVNLKERYRHYKRVFREMYENWYYKSFGRSRCDDRMCPASCECQRGKSLLNKTLDLDDDCEEDEEIAKLFDGL